MTKIKGKCGIAKRFEDPQFGNYGHDNKERILAYGINLILKVQIYSWALEWYRRYRIVVN